MKTRLAVEWLVQKLNEKFRDDSTYRALVQTAKLMEQNQIKNSYDWGMQHGFQLGLEKAKMAQWHFDAQYGDVDLFSMDAEETEAFLRGMEYEAKASALAPNKKLRDAAKQYKKVVSTINEMNKESNDKVGKKTKR